MKGDKHPARWFTGEHMHSEVSAWMHGYDAMRDGKHLYDCPYAASDPLNRQWLNGWSLGMEERTAGVLADSADRDKRTYGIRKPRWPGGSQTG